jgi:hypothetical protein
MQLKTLLELLSLWKKYSKLPAITCSTIKQKDSPLYDWLSELEKEGHRLATHADPGVLSEP